MPTLDLVPLTSTPTPRFIGGECAKTASGSYEDFCADYVDEMNEECDRVDDMEYYYFLQEDGFYALQKRSPRLENRSPPQR